MIAQRAGDKPCSPALREFGLRFRKPKQIVTVAAMLGTRGSRALSDYADGRALSLNTVYTHLRRLREKTGSNRMAELIYKLNELRLPLRA